MKKILLTVLALLMSSVSVACASQSGPPSARGRVTPSDTFKDIVYLTTQEKALHLDLYLHPDAHKRPTPVLVYFHGGGWQRGAKPASWTGFSSYLKAGFSVATVQYRLGGEAMAPAAVQDARCAVKWIGMNADRFGIDPERIVVLGTSAGGHLAMLAGILPDDNRIDAPNCQDVPAVAAIVNLYGPSDLTTLKSRSGGRHSTVAAWIGKGAGAIEMERLLSPSNYVRPDMPPIFVAHGDADPIVPVENSIAFKKLLDEAGVSNALHIVAGGGHGKFSKDEQKQMMLEMLDFLTQVGAIGLPN